MIHTKLTFGSILAGTECPYREQCNIKDHCNHLGKDHVVDYSCAYARAYDLSYKNKMDAGFPSAPDYQKVYYKALKEVCIIHKDQKYDNYPYIIHLISSGEVLTRFGFCLEKYINLHIAVAFHDAVEDQQVKVQHISKNYGDRVGTMVNLCTDEKGLTRKERHEKTYPLIAKDDDAVVVKLCDRIANTEYGISTDNLSQYRKYCREYVYFRNTLRNENNIHWDKVSKMWNHLDNLFDWTV